MSEKIRVLQFLAYAAGGPSSGVTGPEVLVAEQLRFMQEHPEQFSDIVPAVLYPKIGKLYPRFSKMASDGYLQLIDFVPAGRRTYLNALRRAIGTFDPHLVVSQGAMLYDLVTAFGTRRTSARPMIVRHVMISEDLLPARRRALYRVLDRYVVRRAKYCVSCTRMGQATWLKERGRRKPDPRRDRIVYYGIDVRRFRAVREVEPSPDVRRFTVVAQLTAVKGHEVLLDAVHGSPLLRDRARFTFVGDGPLRQKLEAQVARTGLSGVVRFAGLSTNVAEQLAECDVVVLPSWREGYPISLMEAQAAGRPTIGTRVGAVPRARRRVRWDCRRSWQCCRVANGP